MADPSTNAYLTIASDAKRTPQTDPVIAYLDSKFAMLGIRAIVTSILRTPEQQLKIIRDYCIKRGVTTEYKEILQNRFFTDTIKLGSSYEDVYFWQPAWSKLLNIGVIINPPLAAKCLYDYVSRGVNKKGTTISASTHFFGKAFDIGGGPKGVEEKLKVIKTSTDDPASGIKSFLVERENNAIHINVR